MTQWNGVYAATVSSNADPQKLNRLQLMIPQVLGSAVSQWALPVESGITSILPPGSTVMAVFLGGDPSQPAYFHTMNPDIAINGTAYLGAGLQIGGADGSGFIGIHIDSSGHIKYWDPSAAFFAESLPEYAAMLYKNTNGGAQDYAIIAGAAGNDSYWGHNDTFGVGYTGKVTAWHPGTSYPNLTPETTQSITSGFPTGWTGTISYWRLAETNLVYIQFVLSVTNGTAFTHAEVIGTIPASYTPATSSPPISCFANTSGVWTVAPMQVQPNSNIVYQGPAQTLGVPVNVIGQGVYALL